MNRLTMILEKMTSRLWLIRTMSPRSSELRKIEFLTMKKTLQSCPARSLIKSRNQTQFGAIIITTTNGKANENRFLIQELNLDKIKEEIENWKNEANDTESNENVNYPSLFPGFKQIYGIAPKSNGFDFNHEYSNKMNLVSTPRNYEVSKPVEARLTWLDSLPKIHMINVDKFYTRELDQIIELDQE